MTDRELDANVAEKIMSCQPIRVPPVKDFTTGQHDYACRCHADGRTIDKDNPDTWARQGTHVCRVNILAFYSTDIRAAWTALEKAAELGYTRFLAFDISMTNIHLQPAEQAARRICESILLGKAAHERAVKIRT